MNAYIGINTMVAMTLLWFSPCRLVVATSIFSLFHYLCIIVIFDIRLQYKIHNTIAHVAAVYKDELKTAHICFDQSYKMQNPSRS